MMNSRVVPILIIVAFMVSLSLMGFPWNPPDRLGNFSGRVVYSSGTGNLEICGMYNLYNCSEAPSRIQLKLLWEGRIQEIEVDREQRTFSGCMKMGNAAAEVEARLEVDGEVVARGAIHVPAAVLPGIHILRFTSIS